jgi:SAM-dependent methyltransferase
VGGGMVQEQAATRPVVVDARQEPDVEPNYRYWREHGGEWAAAYDSRKKRQVLYHIQELMLTEYILRHASDDVSRPLKVLELGCGVGRHLRNLSRLPGVDVYGYDQSAAMASNIPRWAGRQWFDEHVKIGMPTGRLPYDDGAFDIVYSAEVLVHVRPEHLEGILSEMLRVCRGHVLHLETSEHIVLYTGEHEGCWRHDLPAAYARLGKRCEVLPSGYSAHTPYRVEVGAPARFTWSPAIIEMYRRLERDMNDGFAAVEETARASGVAVELHNRSTIESLEAASRELAARVAAAEESAREAARRAEQASAEVQAAAQRIVELQSALLRTEEDLAKERLAADALRARAEVAAAQLDEARRTLQDAEASLRRERQLVEELRASQGRFVTAVSAYLRP